MIEYEFDEDKGDISNPRVAIDITKFPYVTGNPDGMTIDQDDNLWIALYYGGSVIKANPRNGQLLQVIILLLFNFHLIVMENLLTGSTYSR